MTDTPKEVKNIQLEIWMSKSPEERLVTFLKDNEVLYLFWKQHESGVTLKRDLRYEMEN